MNTENTASRAIGTTGANGVGHALLAALQAIGAFARRLRARHRQWRDARAVYDALRQLDDRTLHDLGFERSEITSVAAEATGEAMRTRICAIGMPLTLP
jgi:uncharacterized protein YjiS (DUF1127 family)